MGYKTVKKNVVKAPDGAKIKRNGPKFAFIPGQGETHRLSNKLATAAILLGLGQKTPHQLEEDLNLSPGEITKLRRGDTPQGKLFCELLNISRANFLSDIAEQAIGKLVDVLANGQDRDKVAAAREILQRLTNVEKRELERFSRIADYHNTKEKLDLERERLQLDRERLALDHGNEREGLVIIPAQTEDWKTDLPVEAPPNLLEEETPQ